MIKDLLIIVFIFCCSFLVKGQEAFALDPQTGSGQMMITSFEYNKEQLRENQIQSNKLKQIEKKSYRSRTFRNIKSSTDEYSFELVFHNLTDIDKKIFSSKVINQLTALNRDFNMLDHKLSDLRKGDEYYSIIDTAKIHFDLANRSYNRTYPNKEWITWNDSKGSSADEKAINIWVMNTPDSIGSYASYPEGRGNFDGIVLDVDYFAEGIYINHDQGKTLTFLMGEYFGLKPLYGAHPCADDEILDTPRHHTAITECISTQFRSTCDNRPLMPMNFMSVSPDRCKYMFTKGQVRRMKEFIEATTTLQLKLSKKKIKG